MGLVFSFNPAVIIIIIVVAIKLVTFIIHFQSYWS